MEMDKIKGREGERARGSERVRRPLSISVADSRGECTVGGGS